MNNASVTEQLRELTCRERQQDQKLSTGCAQLVSNFRQLRAAIAAACRQEGGRAFCFFTIRHVRANGGTHSLVWLQVGLAADGEMWTRPVPKRRGSAEYSLGRLKFGSPDAYGDLITSTELAARELRRENKRLVATRRLKRKLLRAEHVQSDAAAGVPA